jgi:hypothetical protein
MGVSSITVPQLVDQLKKVPEFQGMDFTNDFIMDLFNGLDGFTIEPNEQGVMAVKINNNTQMRHTDKKQADNDKKAVNQAAMNTVKKDMSKGPKL